MIIDVGYVPNPDRLTFIGDSFESIIDFAKKSPYGYKDLLAIQKHLFQILDILVNYQTS